MSLQRVVHRGSRSRWLRAACALASILIMVSAAQAADPSPRSRELFDAGWKFHRGEAEKAGEPGFEAASWRTVSLPHDWAIEPDPTAKGPKSENVFDPDSPAHAGGGYLPGGVGWYRKSFTLPAAAKGRRVFVEFEGVYMESDVWINGQHVGMRPYGYSTFEYELTPHLTYGGQPNVLAVRVNAPLPSSRWYSGAGIYRHVWLTQTDPVHVAHWGTYVTTPKVSAEAATVRVETQVLNQADRDVDIEVRSIVRDPAGATSTASAQARGVKAGATLTALANLELKEPKLWSTETPTLYSVVTLVLVDGKVVDLVTTPFGIRTYEFTKDRGFLLNGKRVPIQGVCQHHDQGCLGSAAYDRAIERQLEILKAGGCNAIRTSHNPPAPKLLELCDRMGFVVMDEAFDTWNRPKEKFDYGRLFLEWHDRDLSDLIRRDRNHPSVILWSIGNEIPNIASKEGAEWAKKLAAICKREDPTRPVTSACNNPDGTVKAGSVDSLGVFGINYNLGRFDAYRDRYLLFSSESASTVSSRGAYNLDQRDGKVGIMPARRNQVTEYDLFVPDWADHAEHMLLKLSESPWIAGEFVWTGFDYIGEPTPFYWPSVVSYFGFIDLCGFPKDRFYLYQSRWSEKPMVHILPHWNWAGWEGSPIPVWCYSNADEVELFLNGKSLGRKGLKDTPQPVTFTDQRRGMMTRNKYLRPGGKTPKPLHFAWDVPYQPGTLRAVARKGGTVVAEQTVHTAGKPAKLVAAADRAQIEAGGQDLSYVTVKVVDEHGTVCPDADPLVRFAVDGPATLIGVGNGDATSHEDFIADHRKAFHGLVLGVVRAGEKAGSAIVKVSAEGLAPAEVKVEVK